VDERKSANCGPESVKRASRIAHVGDARNTNIQQDEGNDDEKLFSVLILLPCLSFAGKLVTVERYANLDDLLIACAGGDKGSCVEADRQDSEIKGLQISTRCLERKTIGDVQLCEFVDGYLAGSISSKPSQ
jgi:hypothetical protein